MGGYTKILWVKSVKRDNGRDWAYFEEGTEDKFDLNFSESHVTSMENVQPGEIILLFQRVDKVKGVKARTYLTHLVTPTSRERPRIVEVLHKFNHVIEVQVIARMRKHIPIYTSPDILNFTNSGFGGAINVGNLNKRKDLSEIQLLIWNMFLEKSTVNPLAYVQMPEVFTEDFFATEGGDKEIGPHITKERNTAVVRRAKKEALIKGNGRILCECCDFDFFDFYGAHGFSFIECHHNDPIAIGGERPTSTADLAMVCSNCHRMLHHKISGTNIYFNVDTLRDHIILEKSKK